MFVKKNETNTTPEYGQYWYSKEEDFFSIFI